MKRIVCLLMLAGLIACNNNQEKKTDRLTFVNNCETLRGFTCADAGPAYSSDYANSDSYSNLTDSIHPWGVAFKEKYGKLTLKNLKKVKLSAYGFFLNPEADCSYCVSIEQDGANMFWSEVSFKKYIKDPKAWTKLEAEIDLPKNVNPNANISVFTWNKGKYPYYIDDYEIKFIE